MNIEDWRRANEIFEQVLELSPEEQRVFLDETCAHEPELRQAVEQRLRADEAAEKGSFLARPVMPPLTTTDYGLVGKDSPPPKRLGLYRILQPIGQGGMGTVYAAERDDGTFHRRVAIKVITAGKENREIVRRMETERQILALLEHPNIARIYDAGSTENGLPYFVMEHVEGEPIDRYCAARGSSVDDRVELIRKVCSAVDYANRNLVVHRDLKPSNILVTPEGDPKLLDFGIAKLLDPASASASPLAPRDTTAPWGQRLTINYASPEQLRGQAISTASDVYALGVLLYQLLTGTLPRSLEGLSSWEAEQHLASTDPLPPSARAVEGKENLAAPPGPRRYVSSQLRGDLDSIVLKALRSDAESRYPSAGQLAEDLERYLQGFPVLAHRGTLRYRAGKLLRRHRPAATLAVVVLLLVGAFAGSRIMAANKLARSQTQLLEERVTREQVLEIFLRVVEDAGPYVSGGVEMTVRQAIDRQAARFDKDFVAQPEVLSAVLSTLGWVYIDLGMSDRAQEYHQRALTLRRGLDEDSAGVADSLDGLAASLRDQWKLDQAAEISATALDLFRKQPQANPAGLLKCLNNRVELCCLRGDWQMADPLSQEALDLSRQAAGDKGSEAPKALIQRAHVLKQLGNLAEARGLYLEAETAYTRRLGPEHPILATLFNNLGKLAADDGKAEVAARYWRRADTQYVAAFGTDFFERVRPLTNIGKHLHRIGDLDGAEATLRTALEVAVRSPSLRPEHEVAYYGRPAIELAKVLIELERCAEVLDLLEAKITRWEKGSSGDVVRTGRGLLEQCQEVSGSNEISPENVSSS